MKMIQQTILSLLVLVVVGAQSAVDEKVSRNLQGVRYQGYKPKVTVTDYAALDLDWQLIRTELNKQRTTSFRNSQEIYQHGAFSRPVAELILDQPLSGPIPAYTEVIGKALNGGWSPIVTGRLHSAAKTGDNVLQIMYDIRDDIEDYVGCLVGSNPNPVTNECFEEDGTVQIPSLNAAFNYTYNILDGNWNARSFQVQSHFARERLHDCEDCPKPDYEKFVNYYGAFDYADHFIMRAFEQDRTDLLNGNHDFRYYGWTGLKSTIENSMVWMTMWMEVISRMERSIDACLVANDVDVRALEFWDSSVAFYTGSQARSGDDSGVFLFHLANDRCLSAKTCGEKGNGADGTAWVNIQVLDLFQLGQGQINARNCEAARNTKEEIVRLMTIPLVQGALRRARLIEDEGFTNERHVAEGAAFAAAVLPIVHDCSIEDAGIIHENLSAGPSLIVDFDAVRDAFGRNLDCIDITCEEVGSDLDLDVNDDFCRLARGEIDSLIVGLAEEEGPSASAGQIILYVILSVIASILCCLTFHCMGNRKDQREIENPSIYRDTVKESELGNDSIVSSKNAVETVITGAEYAPKYWKDGHQSEGDNIEGEVL